MGAGVETGVTDPVVACGAAEEAGRLSADCDWLWQPTSNAHDEQINANVERARYERLKQSSQNGSVPDMPRHGIVARNRSNDN